MLLLSLSRYPLIFLSVKEARTFSLTIRDGFAIFNIFAAKDTFVAAILTLFSNQSIQQPAGKFCEKVLFLGCVFHAAIPPFRYSATHVCPSARTISLDRASAIFSGDACHPAGRTRMCPRTLKVSVSALVAAIAEDSPDDIIDFATSSVPPSKAISNSVCLIFLFNQLHTVSIFALFLMPRTNRTKAHTLIPEIIRTFLCALIHSISFLRLLIAITSFFHSAPLPERNRIIIPSADIILKKLLGAVTATRRKEHSHRQ